MLSEIRRIGRKDSKILIKGKQLTDINIQDVLDGNVDYDDLEKAQRLQLDKVHTPAQTPHACVHACMDANHKNLSQLTGVEWRVFLL